MAEQKHQILVVDDHPIVRDGVARLVAGDARFAVCGEASSWSEAIECAAAKNPAAVVLDISLGNRIGLDLIREFKAIAPRMRVLILSMHDEMVYAERSLRAGAHGYVMKTDAVEKVLEALEVVLGGRMYVSSRLSGLLLEKALHPQGSNARLGVGSLTNRELEVLSLIGKGLSSDAVADRLSLSLKTVEAHRGNIRAKLGLASKERLVEVAIRYTRELQ
jgi:DNA-binding NarL/FixJ family response regulator